MNTDATFTSKGQTTIPKPIRDSLGMKAGDRMSFTLMPDGVVLMRVKNKRVSELAGAKADILTTFSALLDTADLAFEDEPSVEAAVYAWKDSLADFADCLIVARNSRLGCRATATFDSRALKLAGFTLV